MNPKLKIIPKQFLSLFTALSYSKVVDSVKTDVGEERARCLFQLFRKRGRGELFPLQAL